MPICKAQCGVNYLGNTIDVSVTDSRTGTEIYFPPGHAHLVPDAIQQRIRALKFCFGETEFTESELDQLAELERSIPKRKSAGFVAGPQSFSFAKRRR